MGNAAAGKVTATDRAVLAGLSNGLVAKGALANVPQGQRVLRARITSDTAVALSQHGTVAPATILSVKRAGRSATP